MVGHADASRLETSEIWQTILEQLEEDTVIQVAQRHGISPSAIRAAQRRTGQGRARTRVVRPERAPEPAPAPKAPVVRTRKSEPVKVIVPEAEHQAEPVAAEPVLVEAEPAEVDEAEALPPEPGPAPVVELAVVERAPEPVADIRASLPPQPSVVAPKQPGTWLVWLAGQAGPMRIQADDLLQATLHANALAPGRVHRIVDARYATA